MSKQGELQPSRVIDLAGGVEYAENSIVSRTLIDKSAGTLTLFSFDAGQGLSEHSAPFDALVQIIDGAMEISIGGKNHRVNAGQMILMPANVPHALRPITKSKMLLTMIRSE